MNLPSSLKAHAYVSPLAISLLILTVLNLYIARIDLKNFNKLTDSSPTEIPFSTASVEDVAMLFKADKHYAMSSDQEWDSLIPSGHSGFIRLNTTSNPFNPSIYHQIHCLNNLRKIFMGPGWEGDNRKDWHVKHCLNLLFRSVLCNADTTLEPSFIFTLPNGTRVPASHGDDVLHRCRDWTMVRSFAEKNYQSYKHVPFQGP